jgi:hypothetical protein
MDTIELENKAKRAVDIIMELINKSDYTIKTEIIKNLLLISNTNVKNETETETETETNFYEKIKKYIKKIIEERNISKPNSTPSQNSTITSTVPLLNDNMNNNTEFNFLTTFLFNNIDENSNSNYKLKQKILGIYKLLNTSNTSTSPVVDANDIYFSQLMAFLNKNNTNTNTNTTNFKPTLFEIYKILNPQH